MKRRRSALSLASSPIPFGISLTKPKHFREMLKIAWRNRDNLSYAWKILTRGVCDGCALGTSGLRDWTMEDKHLCLVRLNLLRLNTMGPLDHGCLADVASLRKRTSKELRDLGRLAHPMRRRRGDPGFTRVSWDELWRDVGARWGAFDPGRTAMFVTSRGITNEVYYSAQKVLRLLGSNNVDNSARLCHSPSTSGLKSTIGVAATTCSYRDWYEADLIVFFGSNPANDQPVATKYLEQARRRGARVLMVNTYREPGMERYWVPSSPASALFGTSLNDGVFFVGLGGDLAFLNAVQKLLLEKGALQRGFIAEATLGFDAYREHLGRQSFEDLLHASGSSEAAIRAFAAEIERADKGVLVWSMGITQHQHGSDNVRAIANLALLKEWVGREGCGLMPIRGHSGVQGGAEMGAYSSVFPGGVPISAENARHFSDLWGFDLCAAPGLTTVEALEAAERGELDAFYMIGGNFLETMPEPRRIEQALARIPLRLHSDIVLTSQMLVDPLDTVYLLPARTRYEQEGGGTETSTERRVIFSPEIPGHAPGETRSEWQSLCDLARAVKGPAAEPHLFHTAAQIRADIERAVPSYKGIAALVGQGDQFQWGGPHLCAERKFPTRSGKAHFACVTPPAPPPADGRFSLSTRRGKQFNSMIQAQVDALTGAARDHIFIAGSDAARLGLERDAKIRLSNDLGTFDGRAFPAEVTPGTLQGHWPETNHLIPAGFCDREGGVPDYNARVKIEKR